MVEEKNDDLIKLHPIDPGTIPNFARGLEDRLPSTCPKSVLNDEYLELMDAVSYCHFFMMMRVSALHETTPFASAQY